MLEEMLPNRETGPTLVQMTLKVGVHRVPSCTTWENNATEDAITLSVNKATGHNDYRSHAACKRRLNGSGSRSAGLTVE